MEQQGRILWLQTELSADEFQTCVTLPPEFENMILKSVYPENLASFMIKCHPSRIVDGPSLKKLIRSSFRSEILAKELQGSSRVALDDAALQALRLLNTQVHQS
jgi:hypothetical protein